MLEKLEKNLHEALESLKTIKTDQELLSWRSNHIGKKSIVTEAYALMKSMDKAERPLVGKLANEVKQALEAAHEQKKADLRKAALSESLQTEKLDVTLPGKAVQLGKLHPVTRTLRKIYKIFAEMGFQVYQTREVESDDFNFTFLNMPEHHPARDMWDTFYTKTEGVILRTHTSPGQVHAMREYHPEPIRVILPGMCYRYEQVNTRSEMQFNQVEGIAVGKDISFGDLKWVVSEFARRLFHQDVRTRFRASHFPFTEPSAEMDVECFVCNGKGCSVCKQTGWLEIMGCGMVHPNVLRYGGYDPEEFSGFAFGLGPERIAMLLHRITDIRYFWRNDIRFLEQF
jgi:phenylalanyl-tRNA synthetase alpha chain